jgi:acyl-CoA thioester hydrolase
MRASRSAGERSVSYTAVELVGAMPRARESSPSQSRHQGDAHDVSQFRWPVRVYYEDTDAGGVVYYANYLRFMERARTERLRALGFEQDRMREQEGVLFAVRSANLEFLRPARFNDALEVTAELADRRRASLTFDQSVYRVSERERPLCLGQVRIACLDAESLRPRPLPEALAQEIARDG